ncbi:MAG TPA: hypothetical protein PK359_20155 [Burkholderiaceae bacterium]|jgi:hypothetical protein|nr:hypothetical protein [Burkholderiaceae bacterium]
MITAQTAVALALGALYLLFLRWYGGRGRPLQADEIERYIAELAARPQSEQSHGVLDQIRSLVADDDGREFVMQNLVRYRARASYPPGYSYDDDPRAADRRYGKAIVWPLLRHGNLMLFVARRSGDFVRPEGADDWHYVAMVRYRSRRDFLKFALTIERDDITVHKWAAIEKTHIFPVQPVISLILVRTLVAGVLLAAGGLLLALLN